MKNFMYSLQKDISEFKTLSPQVKFLLAIQVIILLIFSILVGVLFSPQFNKNVQQNPKGSPNAVADKSSTQLSIQPKDEIMKVGEERLMSVHIKGTTVTAADIVLTYDPTAIEVSEVTNGNLFGRQIINKIDAGKVYFSAAKDIASAGASKQNTDEAKDAIFGFKIKALKKIETTRIEFSLDETITAENGENKLGITQSAEIHVFD
jgi:hypothetical protein